jgi:hypothetical protein
MFDISPQNKNRAGAKNMGRLPCLLGGEFYTLQLNPMKEQSKHE